MTKKSAKNPAAPPAPAKTREELMDERARADFAHMDRINSDRTIEFRIMNERDPNPLGPVPSEKNRASQAVFTNNDLTFSRVDGDFANSAYMRSRRPPGG